MSKAKRFTMLFAVLSFMLSFNAVAASAQSKNFLPFENAEVGKNSNAYLPTYSPSMDSKTRFIDEISVYAKAANEKWGIPTSAIIGMAAVESGYGSTRIAVHANNIFGIKVWMTSPSQGWQLKGQPDENNGTVPVLANYGKDQLIYDEAGRVDNWYRMFNNYEDAVNYLAGTLLLNKRYGFAKINYENNLNKGWSYERASKQYIYEIAQAGYNHLGGEYYRNSIGHVMSAWDLYKFDEKSFKDVRGHWAQKEIKFLTDNGWIDGYADGTFKPNNNLTRVQAAKIISNYLGLTVTTETVHFNDVPSNHWGHNYIALVAQHKLMNGTNRNRFSLNMNLTRAQMAQIIYNAGFYTHSARSNVSSFKDAPGDHWAHTAIEAMKRDGIMAGYTDGRFGIGDSITRAQMAAVIYRLDQKGWNKK